jgi:2-methylcitrate dehydratase
MLAERLAAYGHALSFKRLPKPVVHEVKRRLLDSLACAFGAWSAPPCVIARRMARSVTVKGGASLWGTAHKTLPELAAFANGSLVRYLDFNDTYLSKEPAHPSDNLAPILAIAETVAASGQDLIEAVVLAYEVHCRLCDSAALRPRGWDHVTYGPFSTALAVGKLLGLKEIQLREAVNLAGVANVALRQTRVGDLSMWKACAFANAARNGVFAARLAGEGMKGPSPIFEGEKGFMKLVSGPFELPPMGGEARRSGEEEPFKIVGTYIKHFPVEYHAQTAVEAGLAVRSQLMKAEGAEAISRIQDVEIGSYEVAVEIIGRDPQKWQPATRETADHSFPYCVAVALLEGRVTLHSFCSRLLKSPALQALMKKIRVVLEPEFNGRYPHEMPTRLTVRTSTGREYRTEIALPVGHPGHPMPDEQIENKFRRLSGRRHNGNRKEQIIERIWNLDRLKNVSALMPLLEVEARGN